MQVNWTKIVAQDTFGIDWENEYIAIVNPTKTTTYIQQALFPYGDISIDTKTIFIDTTLAPLFYPTMQWDSSAYFTNATSPISSTSKYLWNFGDGSATSTDVNPFHTFPAFDSNYVVCLTATNRCGSYTYCDTVWIDSLHIGGSFKVSTNRHSERNEESDASYLSKTKASNSTNQPTTNNCQLINYPNPFDQSTIIDYDIWQTFSKAELRITNVLGQEVYNQKLSRPMDKVQIDGSALHDGLYYYSLIVDGAVKLTKTMSVIR
jgi:PKD repeat protein